MKRYLIRTINAVQSLWAQVVLGGTIATNGEDAGLVVVDGLSATQRRIVATTTYSSTNILAVTILLKGSGTLTLSPESGDADIVITAAELTEMGGGVTFYGRYDSVTAGAGMELLAYID